MAHVIQFVPRERDNRVCEVLDMYALRDVDREEARRLLREAGEDPADIEGLLNMVLSDRKRRKT